MMFSDNAPELEAALHGHFEDRRVNLVNPRREFYKGLQFEEIEAFIKARGLSAQFIKEAEVGIPAKLNTDSERKSNGVPG